MTFNFGHKCTTNESNANHLKSIFNKNLRLHDMFQNCLLRNNDNDYRLQIKEALKIKDLKAYN